MKVVLSCAQKKIDIQNPLLVQLKLRAKTVNEHGASSGAKSFFFNLFLDLM